MATPRKPARAARASLEDSMDEDIPAPAPPNQAPALLQGSRAFPLGAWIAIGLAILLMGFLALSVFLFRSNAPEHDRSDVLNLSRRFVISLTTYSESTLPGQRTAVLSMATGNFRSEFDRLTGAAFANALHETQATSQGKIVNLAVSSVSGDNATVLGVVDVTVSNKDLKTPRIDRQVIQLALVRTSSGWKVDAVTVLGKLS
jgi:Mce-associated membrane protein